MDFTVFGVARSGTTAFAKSVNLHPEVFCGIESFPPNYDLGNVEFPDVFFDSDVCGINNSNANIKILKEKNPLRYGNKFPRYFLNFDTVERSFENIKHFGIYRENFDFVHSWNKRVEAGSNWHEGRTGLVGILEQIMFFNVVFSKEKPSNTYLFSYEKVFRKDINNIDMLFDALNVSPSVIKKEFKRDYFNREVLSSKKRVKKDIEAFSSDYFSISVFDELLAKHSGSCLSEMPNEIFEYVEECVGKSKDFLIAISKDLSQVEREFILKQRGIFRKSLPVLVPALERL